MERSQCGWSRVAYGDPGELERAQSCRPCGMYFVAIGRLTWKQNDLICILKAHVGCQIEEAGRLSWKLKKVQVLATGSGSICSRSRIKTQFLLIPKPVLEETSPKYRGIN